MGILKRLDLFRSINYETKKYTIAGAILSICAFVFILIFFSKEINEYTKTKIGSKLFVLGLRDQMIPINIDMVLNYAPCEKV